MKTTLTLLLLSFSLCYSTDYYFHYDGAGNRTLRTITVPSGGIIAPPGGGNETEESEPNEEKLGEVSIKLYPNPTGGILQVEL